jgi:hypothetical protein
MTMDVQTAVVGVCVAVAAAYSAWRAWQRLQSLRRAGAVPEQGPGMRRGPAAGCGSTAGGCAGCGGGCRAPR